MDCHRTEKFAYRLMDLPGTKMIAFKKFKLNSSYKIIKSRNDETFNIIFYIDEKFVIREVQRVIYALDISAVSRGLWVSLSTERDSDGIHVPAFVAEIFLKLRGQLDFSFTFIDTED